jgi:hypothetical protein
LPKTGQKAISNSSQQVLHLRMFGFDRETICEYKNIRVADLWRNPFLKRPARIFFPLRWHSWCFLRNENMTEKIFFISCWRIISRLFRNVSQRSSTQSRVPRLHCAARMICPGCRHFVHIA